MNRESFLGSVAAKAARDGDCTAVVTAHLAYSYDTLQMESLALSAELRKAVRTNEATVPIAYIGSADQRYASFLVACMMASLTPAPMQRGLGLDVLRGRCEQIGARVVAVDSSLDVSPGPVVGECNGIVLCEIDVAPRPTGGALVLFTSGTSGAAKAVVLTESNVFNMMTTAHREWEISGEARLLNFLPIHHVSATGWMLVALTAGATTVSVEFRNPRDLLHFIDQYRPTHALVVPTILEWLSRPVELGAPPPECLSHVIYASSPIRTPILKFWLDKLPNSQFIQLYGLTECMGVATMLSAADHRSGPDAGSEFGSILLSAGRAVESTELRLCDDSDQPLPEGAIGEVHVRSPLVMSGYLGDDAGTEARIAPGGWLRTGDIGRVEAGYLFLLDRKSDVIIRGGENILPSDIEAAFALVGGVTAVAAVSKPSRVYGEEAVIYAEVAPELVESAAATIAAIVETMDFVLRPAGVRIVDSLPRTIIGKVDRRALRSLEWTGSERHVG